MTKYLVPLLALLSLFLLTHERASASHILGGELTYSCVNSCTIQVELRVYRDCSGSSGIGAGSIVFRPPSLSCLNGPLQISASPALVTELSPVCASITQTTCTNPNAPVPGVQEYYFEQEWDVCVADSCAFSLEWSTCCRPPTITNVNMPASTDILLQGGTVDNTNFNCNGTPEFNTLPPPFLCSGQSHTLDLSATDPEGDSLSYRLGDCINGLGNPVGYSAGYSSAQPLGPSWIANIDPTTGVLTLTENPGGLQKAAVCVYVDEWRNGQLVNTVGRDFVVSIINCPAVLCGTNYVSGTVYRDDNANCVYDSGEIGLENWQILAMPDSIIIPTDSNGLFEVTPDTGTYTFIQIPNPTGLWQMTCPPSGSHTVSFSSTGDSIVGNDFGNEALSDCPFMWVDMGTGPIRPCFSSNVYVDYCNLGTDTAFGAYIEVTLDTFFTIIGSSVPIASTSGNTYTFNVGDLSPSACGSITITADVSCNQALTNLTTCMEAHAFPDSSCFPANPNWDSSNVELFGTCVGDSMACFTVYNTSGSSMQAPVDWRAYQAGVLFANGTLQLCGTCDTTLCFPSNGNALRLEVDQAVGHPSQSTPSATVEFCGQPNFGSNQINLLPHSDDDAYLSIYCGLILNSFDPNEKYVYPSGVDAAYHYIDSSDVLEYKIDFQNLGTADAITVILTDTLAPELDIMSIVPGVSSHSYSWSLLSDRRLRFTFDNINLVPAVQDSMASIGFVKFKVALKSGLQTGTRIENAADIVFDYNAAIRTNTVFNTIGWPVQTSFEAVENDEKLRVYPNPSRDRVFVEAEGMENGRQLRFELFNIVGKRVLAGDFEVGKRLGLEVGELPVGVYVYRVVEGDRMLKAGKLLIQ